MRGLKTQESEKFNRYWALIQEAAQKENCVFFGYAGEGRDFSTESMEGEDFSGWLVPQKAADEFERVWKLGTNNAFHSEIAGVSFVFAIWRKNSNRITVAFETYN